MLVWEFPALIDSVDVPLGFSRIQAAELTNWQPEIPDPEFEQLLESIAKNIGGPPHPPSRSVDLKTREADHRENVQSTSTTKTIALSRRDMIAAIILEELEDEVRWQEKFARSQDVLAKLAAEAMAEYQAGKTQELDVDAL